MGLGIVFFYVLYVFYNTLSAADNTVSEDVYTHLPRLFSIFDLVFLRTEFFDRPATRPKIVYISAHNTIQ